VYTPDFVYINTEQTPACDTILARLPGVPRLSQNELQHKLTDAADPFGLGKHILELRTNRGSFFRKCPGTQGQVCCNYWVLDWANNCPFDCSYCIMQSYLNHPTTVLYVNIDDIITELNDIFTRNTAATFRVGTGEFTDSLALDNVCGYAPLLIDYFADKQNAVLELKTKSDNITPIIGRNHRDRTIVAWSLNPQSIIDREEPGTASLEQRLQAAQAALNEGYRLAFHFDPIILVPQWQQEYQSAITHLCAMIPAEKIAYISMACLRFPAPMKAIVRERFPSSGILDNEFFLCPDNKYRYPRPVRKGVYTTMRQMLSVFDKTPVYFCMEDQRMWRHVFGAAPDNDCVVDQMLKERLFQ
jgi:spore photoproduct lyase